MRNSYANKVVLVTGGTSGIGKATVLAFAEAGAKVVLTGRREKQGEEVVLQVAKLGGKASFVRTDVSKDADVRKAIDAALSEHGRLDVAFNNAGTESTGPLDQVTEEEYRRVFDVNVWGILNSMRHEVAAMLKTGGGAIVNTSSVAGHVGMAQSSIYVGSKHAIEGLTKAVAVEFARQNIRVNAVAPGTIATEMVERMISKDAKIRDFLLSVHPVGHFGTTEEIAAAVLYLASDDARFVTGTVLAVDGGWSAQ